MPVTVEKKFAAIHCELLLPALHTGILIYRYLSTVVH